MKGFFSFSLGFPTFVGVLKFFHKESVFRLRCANQGLDEALNTRWHIRSEDNLSCPLGTLPKPAWAAQSISTRAPGGTDTHIAPCAWQESRNPTEMCTPDSPVALDGCPGLVAACLIGSRGLLFPCHLVWERPQPQPLQLSSQLAKLKAP